MIKDKACKNCIFFLNMGFDEVADCDVGNCRRFSPQLVLKDKEIFNLISHGQRGEYFYYRFPVVLMDDWCGEWKEKPV